MKKWMAFGLGLALTAGLTPRIGAQAPVPAAPAPPAAAGQAMGLFGQLKDALAACKEKFCASCFGQLINNSFKPLSVFTGCPLSCCPTVPGPAELAKPGAEGAAAEIKKREAEARARRLAVRYLGTVDCHWYPEAAAGLIGALRFDPNECVRLEAAIALGRGCCCTRQTMAALLITVNGTNEDGNPAENSERVKAAAAMALAHCLSCYAEVKLAPPPKPEVGPRRVSLPPEVQQAVAKDVATQGLNDFYKKVNAIPMNRLVEEARATLAKTTTSVSPEIATRRSTGHSIAEIMARAVAPNRTPEPGAEAAPPLVAEGPTTSPAAPAAPAAEGQPSPYQPAGPRYVIKSSTPAWLLALRQRRAANAAASRPVLTVSPPATPVVSAPVPTEPLTEARPAVEAKPLPKGTPPVEPQTAARKPAPEVKPVPEVKPATFKAPEVLKTEPAAPAARPAVVAQTRPAAAPAPAEDADTAIENHQQMLALLKNSAYTEQREWAADNLSNFDWRISPEIVDGLLEAARGDKEASVRLASLRCLVRMNAGTAQVVAAVRTLQADQDPQVRAEAGAAVARLTAGGAVH